MLIVSEGEKSEGDVRFPSKEEVASYVSGSEDLPPERAREIEELAAEDPELASKIAVLRLLPSSFLAGDIGPLAAAANALGKAPDDLLPEESEMIARTVEILCSGAVTLDEARAYAIYHLEEEDSGEPDAEGVGDESFDPRALEAVVRAGLFPDSTQAEAALRKVLVHLAPHLEKLGGPDEPPCAEGKPESS